MIPKLFLPTFVVTSLLIGCGGSTTENQPVIVKSQVKEAAKKSVIPTDKVTDVNDLTIEIPVAGNSWILGKIDESSLLIGADGITNWNNINDALVTYVYVGRTGLLNIGIKGKVLTGNATIKVSLNNKEQVINLSNTAEAIVPLGEFQVDEVGYQRIIIRGVDSSSTTFPVISHLVIGGKAAKGQNYYVKDDFYWGRRGPSVHLKYSKPNANENNIWFYSEIEVPQGSDVLGSYFMTNGFAEGYMGIQVNSPTERRVLFSVWSPFFTDDPNDIPDEDKIQLLTKGEHVRAGKFGNEGSGGQSYLVYDWKANTTYKLMVNIKPSNESGKTDYTGYFFDPETNKWRLIASFRRPKTTAYVESQHSFLENFITSSGQFERKGIYKNQWLYSEQGEWHPITEARFTYDGTAKKRSRMDYQGGVEKEGFYLKNTGFFSENTPFNTIFKIKPGKQPDIDFAKLSAEGTVN